MKNEKLKKVPNVNKRIPLGQRHEDDINQTVQRIVGTKEDNDKRLGAAAFQSFVS